MMQIPLSIFIKVHFFLQFYNCIIILCIVSAFTGEEGKLQLLQLLPVFHPGMTHQVFKDEKIVGVKDPRVDIYFNPATCDVCFFIFS